MLMKSASLAALSLVLMLRSLLILAFVPVLNMCAGGGDSAPTTADAPAATMAEAAAPAAGGERMASAPEAEPPQPSTRLLIYSGNLRVQVDRLDTATARVRALTSRLGGYLSGESTERYGSEQRVTFTIRVPARRFDALVSGVEGVGSYLAEKNLQAQDVTEEFRDNEARLKARRAAEAQLMALLQRARTVEEVLKVQEQLQRVREEIEVTEGRNRFLSDRVAYSTLTVTLYVVTPAPERAPQEGFFYKLGQALVTGWDVLKGLVIGLVTIWPLLLIGGGILWWVVRYERRRKAKQAGRGAPPKP